MTNLGAVLNGVVLCRECRAWYIAFVNPRLEAAKPVLIDRHNVNDTHRCANCDKRLKTGVR